MSVPSIAEIGDPTVGGATLTVIANGATISSSIVSLDASGWKPIAESRSGARA